MLPSERHRTILRLLDSQTSVSGRILRARLGTTAMTLWRDLRLLEEQGMLKRVRGGAMRVNVNQEPRFDAKLAAASAAKARIAAYASARLVHDGDILILEGGTTVAALVPGLQKERLTILTNSLPVLNRARDMGGRLTACCAGGLLREGSGTLVGKDAVTFFSRRKADTFFMSATGWETEHGLSDPNPQEIEVKQAMARAANRVVCLLDSSKLGKRSLMQVLPLRKIHVLVCEKDPGPEFKNLLAKSGTQLSVA